MARPHDSIASVWSRCGSAIASTFARCGAAITSVFATPVNISSDFLEVGTVAAATVWINDLFDEAIATVLSSHVGNSGVIWTRHPSYGNTAVVEAGIGSLSGRGAIAPTAYVSDAASEPSTDDYRVIIGLLMYTDTVNDMGVVARFNPASDNGILFWFNRTGQSGRLELYHNGGALLWSSNQVLGIGVEREVELRVIGNKAFLFYEGVERTPLGGVTVVITTGRRVGPRFYQFGDSTPSTGLHMTRLRVEAIAA